MATSREEAEREIQASLAVCRLELEKVARLAEEFDIEGFTLLNSTYHRTREYYPYDGTRKVKLARPGWYEDDYWVSSSGGCQIDTVGDLED